MYPQVIEEWKAYGKLSGDRNDSDFASAVEQGFRSAGWKGALTKSIEMTRSQARRTALSKAAGVATTFKAPEFTCGLRKEISLWEHAK